MNVNRWVRYAKARIDAAVGQGNESLDRLEAERQAELAERPWLAADGTAPSLDEARARIEWEARQQEALQSQRSPSDAASADIEPDAETDTDTAGGSPAGRVPSVGSSAAPGGIGEADMPGKTGGAAEIGRSMQTHAGPRSPQRPAVDAEHEAARLELEDRSRRSADRLAEIRRELGVDDPPG